MPNLSRARKTATRFLTSQACAKRPGESEYDEATGKITTKTRTIWRGACSISDRAAVNVHQGLTPLAADEAMMRLDSQDLLPGDEIHITEPGRWQGPRKMWVRRIPGRNVEVLTRVVVTTTRPGADQ